MFMARTCFYEINTQLQRLFLTHFADSSVAKWGHSSCMPTWSSETCMVSQPAPSTHHRELSSHAIANLNSILCS